MNPEEKYQEEREKIRLKYGKMFRSLYDDIREERMKYIMKKDQGIYQKGKGGKFR
ncbi:MAG: hypothetical protein Q9M94_04980 [Candidatus Gracilibacteria bacterium]|nr:hypothetical protein [Candidatus Gracilibacteria bacterium]